jgi:flagellar basal-body rod protein FlgG
MRAMNIASTGMLAQQTNVEVISNNIANLNTTGFKRNRAEFADLLYQNVSRVGSSTSSNNTRLATGVQIGLGVRTAGVYRIHEQGNLTQTSNRYDVAIDGRGFLRIALPSGQAAYTRAGSFQLSSEGELVTPDGYKVEPGVVVPPNAIDVKISGTGQVQAKLAGEVDYQTVGQLELATFVNEAGLEAMGDNLMVESPASGQPTIAIPGEPGFGVLRQGFLETSNVNPVNEITALITAQRAYEMNSKVITAVDQMMSTTNQLR